MSRSQALISWLEDTSDWLSPLVVKEVRQVVRGREFNYSFGGALAAGLAVAFFGAADALTGSGTSGRWTFYALMGCMAFLGLGVVPLGAFSALRNERMEQTLELITLTALSPRRVVIGKLLAQGVKIATLFAAMAPFLAMSFLLGGIDFVTILLSLAVVFMWSLWSCAVCLFASTLLKSRAMSGVVFGAVAVVLFVLFSLSRAMFFMFPRGGPVVGFGVSGGGGTTADMWWTLAIATTFCLATMVNLVLLAENRLSLPTENRVTPLRVGFLVQFLLIVGWTLTFIKEPPRVQDNALNLLGVAGGIHLAIVAMFTLTEDLVVPRRVLRRMKSPRGLAWLMSMFWPGGGRGAGYVLRQMAVLLAIAWLFHPAPTTLRWFWAMCGYICFFTGIPTLALRMAKPAAEASLKLRVIILLLVPISMLLPDVIHYVVWRPEILDLSYSARHLINPLRTLANWSLVEMRQWTLVPFVLGMTGVVSYGALIVMGANVEAGAADRQRSAAAAGEPGSADATY
ncbi:MAG TPA: hypothetical protein VKH34_01585 [Vicinamibacterales bacterium]|nr:hypothetical protein [Vicinamibacterales bacterium]